MYNNDTKCYLLPTPRYTKHSAFINFLPGMNSIYRRVQLVLAFLFALGTTFCANGQDLVFASVPTAKSILSAKDAFTSRMSQFDRSARLKTNREVPEAEFLEFASSSALKWELSEINIIRTAYENILPAIAHIQLPLPKSIYIIKTTGREEGNATYTRENAIIFPKRELYLSESEIQRILAHELFHIASRKNPKLSRQLYETIGFHYCGEVILPPKLEKIKITNPDAPKNDYCINLRLGTERIVGIPILLSRSQKYDPSRGGEFFDYLKLAYLLVEPNSSSTPPRVIYNGKEPKLVRLNEVSGFFEQVGQNTDYIIHPEEILADNFALLMVGSNRIRSPGVLKRIQFVLESQKETE